MLQYFGAGDPFINLLFVLFTNFSLCTQSNGYTSELFPKRRGVNQGCPASPTVFIWAGELLAHLLENHRDIQGISVNNLLALLSQFADDTGAYLKFDRLVISAFCNVLKRVEDNLGLKVSYDKTSLYRVGSITDSNARFYTEHELNWTNDDISTLGVTITCAGEIAPSNYEDIIKKLDAVCEAWANRSLSLFGKVVVINTLMASLFVYKFSVLLNLNMNQLNQVHAKIHNFLWNGKKARIAMKTLTKDRKQGGLRLVDIEARQSALKTSWILRLESDHFLATCAYSELNPTLRNLIWRCNLAPRDVRMLFGDGFWAKILLAWSNVQYNTPSTKSQIWNQIIWLNSYIRVNGKPIVNVVMYINGLVCISDLFHENGIPKQATELTFNVNWLDYQSILSAIPTPWKMKLKDVTWGDKGEDMFNSVAMNKSCARVVYNRLIDDNSALLKYIKIWNENGINIDNEELLQAMSTLHSQKVDVKYKDFQYRLMLYKIVTNVDLHKWKWIDSPACSFCDDNESYEHLFLHCPIVLPLINLILLIAKIDSFDTWDWLSSAIVKPKANIVNEIATICKQFIYRHRCTGTKPNVVNFKRELWLTYRVEYSVASRSNKLKKFNIRWDPVIKFI